MLLTIALLILVYSLTGKSIDNLVSRIKNVNWKEKADSVWTAIRNFGLKAGRTTCKPLLTFYYVMADENTTAADKGWCMALSSTSSRPLI